MASLKCLACGQDNKVGDESCTSCSSSLNLRLCSACEAINATSAERCHSCGAAFGPASEAASTLDEVAAAAPTLERELPAAWVAGAEQATRSARRARTTLWLLPLVALGGVAYYFYGMPQAAAVKQAAVLATPPPPAAEIKRVVLEVERPAVATAKPPPAPQSKISFEPKRAAVPVTATVERPGRVTHTRAEPSESAQAMALPALDRAAIPGAAAKPEAAACPPAVVALGLCKSN